MPGFSFTGALTWAVGAGIPIVAGRIPAFVEVNETAGCFVLVSPGSPRELAHRVRPLEADPEQAARLAQAARAYASEVSWERVAERHAELYARSADQAAAARTAATGSWRSARSASVTSGSPRSQDGAEARRPAGSVR